MRRNYTHFQARGGTKLFFYGNDSCHGFRPVYWIKPGEYQRVQLCLCSLYGDFSGKYRVCFAYEGTTTHPRK